METLLADIELLQEILDRQMPIVHPETRVAEDLIIDIKRTIKDYYANSAPLPEPLDLKLGEEFYYISPYHKIVKVKQDTSIPVQRLHEARNAYKTYEEAEHYLNILLSKNNILE